MVAPASVAACSSCVSLRCRFFWATGHMQRYIYNALPSVSCTSQRRFSSSRPSLRYRVSTLWPNHVFLTISIPLNWGVTAIPTIFCVLHLCYDAMFLDFLPRPCGSALSGCTLFFIRGQVVGWGGSVELPRTSSVQLRHGMHQRTSVGLRHCLLATVVAAFAATCGYAHSSRISCQTPLLL